MQAIDAGDLELERRFGSYARARLSPDPRSTARIRARVMREVRLQHEAARIAVHVAPAIAANQRSTYRRIAMPFLAATVWLGIAVGTMSAAQAGGPLYPTRLWIEAASLPTSAIARIEADLQRMDTRLSEALAAATSGDRGAVSAALEAYARIAEDATANSGADPALLAKVEEALSQHQAVLTAVAARLADKGNDNAAEAITRNIQRAIEHNAAVIQNLATHNGGGSQPNGNGGAGQGGGGQGGGGQGAGGGTTGNGTTGGGGGAAGGDPGGNASGGAGGNGGGAGVPAGGGPDKPEATPKPTPDRPDRTPRGKGN